MEDSSQNSNAQYFNPQPINPEFQGVKGGFLTICKAAT